MPKLIHRWLTPRGLAHWYMDDGSIKSSQSKGVIFNTQGFDRSDVDRLIGVLQSKFGLKASRRRQPEGDQIYVSGSSFESFFELVDPYVTVTCGTRCRLPDEHICLKCNGGAQRFPQYGWKSYVECKGIRELDCETDKSSRCESRP